MKKSKSARFATKACVDQQRLDRLLTALLGPPPVETLRNIRAIQALEQIGTPSAIQVLQEMAQGAPGAWETKDAQNALQRLAERQKSSR